MLNKIKTPAMEKLIHLFESNDFAIRLVGGVVRDLLCGLTPKDIDFCTDATPDEMVTIAKKQKVTTIPTGIDHGTLTFVIDEEQFEVTTLRVDEETDGRHATVKFVRNFEEDAARRDLTINAMSMDSIGNVYDYFGGQADLLNKRVRFVGVATKRIEEDYLRILRYFRFLVRFGDTTFENIIKSPEMDDIRETRNGLMGVSGERIWSEMSKILALPNSGSALKAMRSTGVMRTIGLPYSSASYEFIDQSDDVLTNLGTFLYSDTELNVLTDRWKISSKEFSTAKFLCEKLLPYIGITTSYSFDELLRWMVDGADRNNVLRLATYHDFVLNTTLRDQLLKVSVPVFPVMGRDLIAMGFEPGKALGDKLKDLREKWLESNYTLDKQTLLETVN